MRQEYMTRLKTLNLPAPLWMILSVSLFSINHALVKLVSTEYTAASIVFYRSIFSLGFLVLFLKTKGFVASFKTNVFKIHLLRGLFGALFLYLTVLGLRGVSLTVFTAIFYTSPLMTIVISSLFLKEPWRRGVIISSLFCCAGMVLMFTPLGDVDPFYGSVALLCALCHTIVMLLSRKASQSQEKSETMIVYYIGVTFLFAAILADFTLPKPLGLLIISLIGLVQLMDFYCFVRAIEKSPVNLLATYEYLSLLWAPIFGYMFYGEIVTIPIFIAVLFILVGSVAVSWKGISILMRSLRDQDQK